MVLPLIVDIRFQVHFHSPHRGTFHLSLTVLCAIGYRGVFSLGRWSSQIPTRFHVSRGTRGHPRVIQDFAYRTITVYGRPFQTVLLSIIIPHRGPTTPYLQADMVWAVPRSLAATNGISIDFFSSGYLDVSVPRVRFPRPMYSVKG